MYETTPKQIAKLYQNPKLPVCKSRSGVLRYEHSYDKDRICILCDYEEPDCSSYKIAETQPCQD